jgi:ribosome biogenesis protein MAK21
VATILKSGTTADKVSALTLLVQESTIHHFKELNDSLFHGMAMKKSRRDALMAIDSIKDLLIGYLLPDRKLKYFSDQPSASKQVTFV